MPEHEAKKLMGGKHHSSPLFKNLFIGLIMIAVGAFYLSTKLGYLNYQVPANILEYTMAILVILGGIYRLKKAFEVHVIRF